MKTKMALGAMILLAAAIVSIAAPPQKPATAKHEHHAASTPAATNAQLAWEKMKTLVGRWEAKDSQGRTHSYTYELVSAGTALMERIDDPSNPQHSGMVTLYHLDDDRFMLTHYCAVNNQPRMRALAYSPESRTLAFEFLDVTNLQNSVEGHMRGLAFKFLDDDHVTAAWTFQPKQKEAFTETFQLTRIR